MVKHIGDPYMDDETGYDRVLMLKPAQEVYAAMRTMKRIIRGLNHSRHSSNRLVESVLRGTDDDVRDALIEAFCGGLGA